ncbi:hypothetical protein NQ203_05605, partial [Pseudomonas aeruginosa]
DTMPRRGGSEICIRDAVRDGRFVGVYSMARLRRVGGRVGE